MPRHSYNRNPSKHGKFSLKINQRGLGMCVWGVGGVRFEGKCQKKIGKRILQRALQNAQTLFFCHSGSKLAAIVFTTLTQLAFLLTPLNNQMPLTPHTQPKSLVDFHRKMAFGGRVFRPGVSNVGVSGHLEESFSIFSKKNLEYTDGCANHRTTLCFPCRGT